MVHVRRHRARDISPAVPSGRRIQARWAALALAIVCTASLVGLFSSHLSAASPIDPGPSGTAVPTATPPIGLGLNLGFNADSNDALRAPDPGSVPSPQPPRRSAPSTSTAAPEAGQTTDQWGFLHRAATGQWLFLTGFLLLLLSIGGLVTVGIYRRRW
jgi:hypothetical protein